MVRLIRITRSNSVARVSSQLIFELGLYVVNIQKALKANNSE